MERLESRHNVCVCHAADRYRACWEYSHTRHSAGHCEKLQWPTVERSDVYDQRHTDDQFAQPNLRHCRRSTVHLDGQWNKFCCNFDGELEWNGISYDIRF